MVVNVASVAEGVDFPKGIRHGTGGEKDIAPGVVGVGDDCCAAGVQNCAYIALQVRGVVVGRSVTGYGHWNAAGIVGKVHSLPGGGAAIYCGSV